MVNVKLGGKTYDGVAAIRVDTADGSMTEFAPYDEAFAEGKEEGIQTEYDRFWNNWQNNGGATGYQYAFCGPKWNEENFRPKYDILCTAGYSAQSMFQLNEIPDLSEALNRANCVLRTEKAQYFTSMYQQCKSHRVPGADMTSAIEATYMFLAFTGTTVDKLVANSSVNWGGAFQTANSLANITFEGVIGTDIDFHWSPLTSASIESVITHLSDTATGKTATFKLSSVDTAFETAEGLADGSSSQVWLDLVATKPNWTISLV